MMEKEPSARIQSAGKVAARLSAWARGEGPLPERMRMSAWVPPPLPNGPGELPLGDDSQNSELDSSSQGSQGTSPIFGQETRAGSSVNLPPPPSGGSLLGEVESSPWTIIMITAGIAVPIGLCVGAMLTFLLLRLLG